MSKKFYIVLDVAQKKTQACAIDEDGKIIREKELKTHPAAIIAWVRRYFTSDVAQIGLESGALSPWLHRHLQAEGLPVVCLDAFQTHRALSVKRNKNDTNDARGIAELLRMGVEWIGAVHVKSIACQEIRTLLTSRLTLVNQRVELENTIRGMLKPYGGILQSGHKCAATFRERVIDTVVGIHVAEQIDLRPTIVPLLDLHGVIYKRAKAMEETLTTMAKDNPVCERFMEVPGVGPITALSFYSTIEDPHRFNDPRDVAAYLGLTPRTFQSGEYQSSGQISKRGNKITRLHMVQAATVMLSSMRSWSSLKSWGIKLSKRIGFNKAKVAVARKLSIILFLMWRDGTCFEYGDTSKPQSHIEAA